MRFLFIFVLLLSSKSNYAKEVALTFDDSPNASSLHFKSKDRVLELIRKLKLQNITETMIFANPCKNLNTDESFELLKLYKNAGHLIGNHTCNHARLDNVGFDRFIEDIKKADELLAPLYHDQKFFRFPYLNEGKDPPVRNKMRDWLKQNDYRNAAISGDNEDPTFSAKINEAKKLGKVINYSKVKKMFLQHILSSLECNDRLATELLGRSPKHILLLHEADATVMFIDSLVEELKLHGWKIITPTAAYKDTLYSLELNNTHSGLGIISQLSFEKTGKKAECYDYGAMVKDLNRTLGLKND